MATALCAGFCQALASDQSPPSSVAGKQNAPPPPAQPLAPARINTGLAIQMAKGAIMTLNQSNKANDYASLLAMGTPRFQSLSPKTVATYFKPLRAQKITFDRLAGDLPRFSTSEVGPDGVAKLSGIFVGDGSAMNAFELRFIAIDHLWRLHGIAVWPLPSDPYAAKASGAGENPKLLAAPGSL